MLPFIAIARLTHHRLITDQDTSCAAAVQRIASSLPANRPGSYLKRTGSMLCLLPAAVLLSMLGATQSPAETLGDARVGFTAERVLVLDGRRYVGRIWHMPGEQRHEQDLPAINPVFILRAGSTLGDVVLPQLHTVVEFALPKEFSLLGNPNLLRKPVGQETVNGIMTTKYTVEEDVPGARIAGSLWLSRDGIPMKCDGKFEPKSGKSSTIYWELRHVKIGNQDKALFEVPQGYAKLPPEAAAPLLGMRLARPPAR
jgi:hypothetical protein